MPTNTEQNTQNTSNMIQQLKSKKHEIKAEIAEKEKELEKINIEITEKENTIWELNKKLNDLIKKSNNGCFSYEYSTSPITGQSDMVLAKGKISLFPQLYLPEIKNSCSNIPDPNSIAKYQQNLEATEKVRMELAILKTALRYSKVQKRQHEEKLTLLKKELKKHKQGTVKTKSSLQIISIFSKNEDIKPYHFDNPIILNSDRNLQ